MAIPCHHFCFCFFLFCCCCCCWSSGQMSSLPRAMNYVNAQHNIFCVERFHWNFVCANVFYFSIARGVFHISSAFVAVFFFFFFFSCATLISTLTHTHTSVANRFDLIYKSCLTLFSIYFFIHFALSIESGNELTACARTRSHVERYSMRKVKVAKNRKKQKT